MGPLKTTAGAPSNTTAAVDTRRIPSECIRDAFFIESASDVLIISKCSEIEGDLVIRGFSDPLLVLENLLKVDGALVITGSPNLVRIEAPQLSLISGTFKMEKLTSLALVHMPELANVSSLEWRVLPILGSVNFGHIEGLESIVIADTSLTGVSGFSSTNLRSLDINNNRFLEFIKSEVQHISGHLHIAANADNVEVELGKLQSTFNMSVHNVASLDIALLEEVKGSMNIISNLFARLDIPKLESVGGTFSLSKNDYLESVDLSALGEVGGGLLIMHNPFLSKIDFLPKLSIIGGALELVGNIKLVTWKSLKLVKGSARVMTSDSSFNCALWKANDASNVVRGGKIECGIVQFSDETSHVSRISGTVLRSGAPRLSLELTLVLTLVAAFSFVH